jgi:hypothetical protein
MQLSIAHDLDKLKKSLNTTGEKVFKPSLNAAINKTGTKHMNAAITAVGKVQRVKRALVKAKVDYSKSNYKTLTFTAEANYKGITWNSLGAKTIGRAKNTKGVRAGNGANRHIHSHAFIAQGKYGKQQVFVRDTNARYPLRVLRVRLYETFNREFKQRIKTAKDDVLTELDKQIEWRVKKELEKSAN